MKAPVFLATIAATCLSTYTLAQQTVGTFQANDFIQLFETMTGSPQGTRPRPVCDWPLRASH